MVMRVANQIGLKAIRGVCDQCAWHDRLRADGNVEDSS
jgi:hypothetical protein